MTPTRPPRVLVVMGVSGAGKTTVAEALAARLHWPFQEGDALHPAANVAKMRAGTPLTDEDRAPWLELIADWIGERLAQGECGIVTCSALKQEYRRRLVRQHDDVWFVLLHASRETLQAHVDGRHHAYMPVGLLDSQLATLEQPSASEPVVTVPVEASPAQTVAEILQVFHLDR